MHIAYWRTESVCVLRHYAANWKLKTLQIWTPLPIDAKMHSCVNILARRKYTYH
jgi:hypothetical protein